MHVRCYLPPAAARPSSGASQAGATPVPHLMIKTPVPPAASPS